MGVKIGIGNDGLRFFFGGKGGEGTVANALVHCFLNGGVCSPKTIPTSRLLYAVALFASYSSNKSPVRAVTESDMVPKTCYEGGEDTSRSCGTTKASLGEGRKGSNAMQRKEE